MAKEKKGVLDKKVTYYFINYPWFPGAFFVVSVIFIIMSTFLLKIVPVPRSIGLAIGGIDTTLLSVSLVLFLAAGIWQVLHKMVISGLVNIILVPIIFIIIGVIGFFD